MSVYFLLLQSPEMLVKIGKSGNVKSRVEDISISLPYLTRLIAETDFYEESELHTKFAKYRLNGEWFRYEREIQDFVRFINDNSPDILGPAIKLSNDDLEKQLDEYNNLPIFTTIQSLKVFLEVKNSKGTDKPIFEPKIKKLVSKVLSGLYEQDIRINREIDQLQYYLGNHSNRKGK